LLRFFPAAAGVVLLLVVPPQSKGIHSANHPSMRCLTPHRTALQKIAVDLQDGKRMSIVYDK